MSMNVSQSVSNTTFYILILSLSLIIRLASATCTVCNLFATVLIEENTTAGGATTEQQVELASVCRNIAWLKSNNIDKLIYNTFLSTADYNK